MRMRWALVALLWVAGCDDDESVASGASGAAGGAGAAGASGQAGAAGAAGVALRELPAVAEPAPPAAPAPPVFAPCPGGWSAQADGGVDACRAPTAAATCPPGQAPQVGAAGCQPLGPACPQGKAPEGLPAGALHVEAGAEGGDGSEAKPYGSIQQAVDAAAAGATVAIHKGEYAEHVRVTKALTLRGACVEAVSLRGDAQGAVEVGAGGDLTLSAVTLGGDGAGLRVEGGKATARGVWVREATGTGVKASAKGSLALQDALIGATRPLGDGTAGQGIVADGKSQVQLDRVWLEANRSQALWVQGKGTQLKATRLGVRATQVQQGDGLRGRAAQVEGGAELQVEQGIFADNRNAAVLAYDAGTLVALSAVEVLRTQANTIPDGSAPGWALGALDGAHIEGQRLWIDESHDQGVAADGEGSEVKLSDVVLRGTAGTTSMRGAGLSITGGAAATLSRVVLAGNRRLGAYVGGKGSRLAGTDVRVAGTLGDDESGDLGAALTARDGAEAQIERGAFEDNLSAGAYAFDAGTSLVLRDVAVRRTLADKEGSGVCAAVAFEALLSVDRVLCEDCRLIGLLAQEGATLSGQDVEVRGTRWSFNVEFGQALYAGESTVDLTRLRMVDNQGRSIAITGRPLVQKASKVTLTDLILRDTRTQDDGNNGIGINADNGTEIAVTNALLDGNHVAGMAFNSQANATLRDITVRRSAAGSFIPGNDPQQVNDVGDGLVALDSSVNIDGANFSDCYRAGLLFDGSSGKLRNLVSTGNGLGLVLQGATAPDHDDSCVFGGNRDGAVVSSGELAVPDAPIPLPPSTGQGG